MFTNGAILKSGCSQMGLFCKYPKNEYGKEISHVQSPMFKKRSTNGRKRTTMIDSEPVGDIQTTPSTSSDAPNLPAKKHVPLSKDEEEDTQRILAALRKEADAPSSCKFSLGRLPSGTPSKIDVDIQPDVCKDWLETGFCGYGDNCKFAHIRVQTDTAHSQKVQSELRLKREKLDALLKGKPTEKPIESQHKCVEENSVHDDKSCVLCGKEQSLLRSSCKCMYCTSCSRLTKTGENCVGCGAVLRGVFSAE
ncbi:hypothetical protein P9112_003468 [Eukaryota sp. TZLM1-RC]